MNQARARPSIYCANLLFFLAALILAAGCSTSPPRKRGIKLSEASKEARKEPEDQKPVRKKKEKGEKDEPIVEEDDDPGAGIALGFFDTDESDSDGGEEARDPAASERIHLGVVVGGGSLGNDELDGFALFGVQVGSGFFDERLRLDIRGLIMPTNQSEKPALGSGLDNEIELAGDIGARYYLTPGHTFMGLYTHLGLRVGNLSWDYKNPIQVVGTGGQTERLDTDGVNFFAVFGGVGVSLAQLRKVHVGANLAFGYKTYSSTTNEGFENDVFSDEPFTQLMLEFTGSVDSF